MTLLFLLFLNNILIKLCKREIIFRNNKSKTWFLSNVRPEDTYADDFFDSGPYNCLYFVL